MSMLPTRKIMFTFVGVFVIGAVVGGMITWDFTDLKFSRFLKRTSNPESMEARINQKYTQQYGLSADEQKRIAPLAKAMAQKLYDARHHFGADIVATLNDYHQQIAAQMTPEHRAAYEKDNVERMKLVNGILLPDASNPEPSSR
jgi:hypothetical protein